MKNVNFNNIPIPISTKEVKERGWESVDVVLITADAYVDHPSFGIAIIGRVLEKYGYKVAILSQPDWRSVVDFKKFGRPDLFFGISSGNMDSMVNKYTALKKVRNNDAYSEGGTPFKRPDRASIVYAHRVREAYSDVPIILGGLEASLRRFAHYDFWSERVRRSIIIDSRADLIVYGMGERQIVEIAGRLKKGEPVNTLHNIQGTVFVLNESEDIPIIDYITLPSYEEVAEDKKSFSKATKLLYYEANRKEQRCLVQFHGKRKVIQLPPPPPMTEKELDAVYELPYTRKPHPFYKQSIPAWEMIKNSVTILRGCFGGCTFCSISLHQGKDVQSRSEESVLREIKKIASSPKFDGIITDLGGPTANMYKMNCMNKDSNLLCKNLSCIFPSVCKNLSTDHTPLIELMKKATKVKGVKKVIISSGIRMDLALCQPEYIREIALNHTGGYLKVAPEHVSKKVLNYMKKPGVKVFDRFSRVFEYYSKKAGKEQYLIPYLISAFPGAEIEDELILALYLKKKGIRPRQIQDFLPAPMEASTSMFYTGLDTFSEEKLYVARGEGERRLHRAIIQYFKPKNKPLVLKVLKKLKKNHLAKLFMDI